MKKRKTYTLKEKLTVLDTLQTHSQRATVRLMGVPRRNVREWKATESELRGFKGSALKRSFTKGRKESIPFSAQLLSFMKDGRQEEKFLGTRTLLTYIRRNHAHWLTAYLAGSEMTSKTTAVHSLFRLLQRFARRHGFSQRTPTRASTSAAALEGIRDSFSSEFWKEHVQYQPSDIINVDETGICLDSPPKRCWSERGGGDARILEMERHSARMTAVLGARADGRKLPILFIVRGAEHGSIRERELSEYPQGHYYTTQTNAWMDSRVWREYLRDVLQPQIEEPSVVLLDNLDSHVSKEAHGIVADELFSKIQALPPNSTSVCQPLDVGVMGPLKKMLEVKWLDEEKPTEKLTAKEKRIMMIERTIRVWESVSEETIRSSFTKALPCAIV